MNGFDCGVFVCKNIQCFLFSQPTSYTQGEISRLRKSLYYMMILLGAPSNGFREYELFDYLEKHLNQKSYHSVETQKIIQALKA